VEDYSGVNLAILKKQNGNLAVLQKYVLWSGEKNWRSQSVEPKSLSAASTRNTASTHARSSKSSKTNLQIVHK